MALPAWGSHSDIQRERRREGGRKIENRMLRKEGRVSKNEQESDRERGEGSKGLCKFTICPFCTQLALEQRNTEHRTI